FFMYRGPLTQDFLAKQTQSCQLNGWQNLLFVQNFFHTDVSWPVGSASSSKGISSVPPQGLPSTWIFCVELQLMLFTSPLLFLYRHSHGRSLARANFWLALPLLVLAGFVYNFVQVYVNKLPPAYYWTLPDKE